MYDIEELHESGKMPTRYYNQLNRKSAQENYNKLLIKRQKKNERRLDLMKGERKKTVILDSRKI